MNRTVRLFSSSILLGTFALVAACGGGGGGAGGGGGGLAFVSFLQASQDNVPLNRVLQFTFSDAVDPATVGPSSIQIREGDAFGLSVPGTYRVLGAQVFFEPQLPALCDYSDSGFKPATTYRVLLTGYPEEFAIRSVGGNPLLSTVTFSFLTRPDSDPELFEDQIPGVGPVATSCTPGEVPGDTGANAAVLVRPADGSPARVVIQLSENLDPCTVNPTNVVFSQWEVGDPVLANGVTAPNGNLSGFSPATDSAPGDPFTWGASNSTPTSPAQIVPSAIHLVQTFSSTEIHVEPFFGEFPDNALLVLELTFGIRDFGGQPLTPRIYSFTTQNRPPQNSFHRVEFLDETPIDAGLSTAEVNTARAVSKAQGYLLFSGDGDNGFGGMGTPGLPETPASGCTIPRHLNDGAKDDFDPATDTLLDTGATRNTCPNTTDGSNAVIWEFNTFRIRNGVTVRIIGVNPAILLVQGDVLIENGGRLLLRGDNAGGSPQGRGASGSATTNNGAQGGIGVAGGGDGGSSPSVSGSYPARYGDSGKQGYYHLNSGAIGPDIGTAPGVGGGHGNTSAIWQSQTNPNNRNTASGGGGGHAVAGGAGAAGGSGSMPTALDLTPDGAGGAAYGLTSGRMPKAEAGSGGGAGGEIRPFSGNAGRGPGGAGGAGGGFIDITSGGDITIQGTIDAAGGSGGRGATQPFAPNYSWQPGSGGGGGGSGGGIRLLTPNEINLAPGAVITAAGGSGGVGGDSQGGGPPVNSGGAGGMGRLVMEDGDSVITGIAGATVLPGEGAPGFYRATFDATRFQGGGLRPEAVTLPFFVGPTTPSYAAPAFADFIAGVPDASAPGVGLTSILIEAQGYPLLADGSADLTAPSGWYTVGYFTNSGTETTPNWVPSANPVDVVVTNSGVGFSNLNGLPWIQLRITFYLKNGVGPLDPGPWIDRWDIRFSYDQ